MKSSTAFTILLLLVYAYATLSATVDIIWNKASPNQVVSGYWILMNDVRYKSVTVTNGASFVLNNGLYKITLTATNVLGESPASLPLNIRVRGNRVTIE